jgi:hypothetical protein
MRKVTPIAFTLTKKHHDIVKRVAKKLKINKSEVIRRRIKSFDEMVHELQEDMKLTGSVPLNRF